MVVTVVDPLSRSVRVIDDEARPRWSVARRALATSLGASFFSCLTRFARGRASAPFFLRRSRRVSGALEYDSHFLVPEEIERVGFIFVARSGRIDSMRGTLVDQSLEAASNRNAVEMNRRGRRHDLNPDPNLSFHRIRLDRSRRRRFLRIHAGQTLAHPRGGFGRMNRRASFGGSL